MRVARIISYGVALALFVVMALAVGDGDYRATFIGWAGLLMMVVIVPLSLAYVRVLRAGVVVDQGAGAADCERGSTMRFEASARNGTPLATLGIEPAFRVVDASGREVASTRASLALGPFASQPLGFSVSFPHVGIYELGISGIRLEDPLGLFPQAKPCAAATSVRVLPRLVPLKPIEFSLEAADESPKLRRALLSDSLNYASVRDYEPGDPLKSIHWKLSARQGDYLTRVYERYTNPSATVLIDFYSDWEDAAERAAMFDVVVEAAFSIAEQARRRSLEVQVQFPDRFGGVRSVGDWSSRSLARMLDDMPPFGAEGHDRAGFRDALREACLGREASGNIVVCSADIDGESVALLLRARAAKRAVFFVAAVPPSVVDADRTRWCAPLAPLAAAGAHVAVLSREADLEAMRL